MDCGGEIGDADKYIRQLCSRKSFDYMGVKQIVMPEIMLLCSVCRMMSRLHG